MLSDFYAFLLALLPHWWVFLTSGPASVDRVLRNHWAAYAAWADKRWDAHARARLFRQVAFAGVFVAGFLAFRDEHHQLLDVRRVADQASDKRERSYPDAYQIYAKSLHDKLDAVLASHPYWWIYIGFVDNPSSVKLAENIRLSVKRVKSQVTMTAAPEDDPKGEGLTLLVHNSEKPTPDDQTIIDAFRSSGFNVKLDETNKDPEYAQELFGVYISYPPL